MLGTRSEGRPAGNREAHDALPNAPRLVLGLGRSGLATAVENHFVKQGWDVVHTSGAAEAGRYAHTHRVTAVILPVSTGDESGLLTCAKLSMSRRRARIVLVGPENDRLMEFAKLAGAVGYIPCNSGIAAIVRAALGN